MERPGAESISVSTNMTERELTLERTFNAPRELVFRAFTEPEHLMRWFGPNGWSLPVCTIDLRPGGVWQYGMRGPNGEESWGRAVYREIVEPERLVYTDSFTDKDGNVLEDMPQMLVTVTFADAAGKTRLTSRTQFGTTADLEAVLAMGVVKGTTETWERLEAELTRMAS